MEPYVVPFHSSTPPPLDDYGGVDVESEDEEFGDFGGFPVIVSCSSSNLPKSKIPSGFRETSNLPVDQPASLNSVSGSCRDQVNMKGQVFRDSLSSRLPNGYTKGDSRLGPCDAFQVESFSSVEDDGFADFSVFAEQTTHPWCCGFSPLANTQQGDVQVEGTDPGGPVCDVIMDSEPRSLDNVSTITNYCERRFAAVVKPSQDHHDPQEAAAGLESLEVDDPDEQVEEEDSEIQENEDAEKKTITSVYDSASEDLASLCDDSSFDGVSADLEPNVSSLVSQEDENDWEQTDDEDDELGHCGNSPSLDNTSLANLCQTEDDRGFQTETLEPAATSTSSWNQDNSVMESTADRGLGGLQPSDSFADFCSAPTEGDGEGSWAEFPGQRLREEGQNWTDEGDRRLETDGDFEELWGSVEECGGLRRNSCQNSFSCRVHQLFWSSFPNIGGAAVEEDEETLTLGARLFPPMPDLRGAQGLQSGLWWPYQDVTGAIALQFQWPGSHTNTTLLRCLSVDRRHRGSNDATKDSVPGNGSKTDGPPGPGTKPQPSVKPLQLERSSRGLTSAQGDFTAVHLDYFGFDAGEKSRSSRSDSPPPGVDRELDQLTMNKLETDTSRCHLEDTKNRPMSAAQKTSLSLSEMKMEETLCSEAAAIIAKLPNLSFMRASLLMFPTILVPEESDQF